MDSASDDVEKDTSLFSKSHKSLGLISQSDMAPGGYATVATKLLLVSMVIFVKLSLGVADVLLKFVDFCVKHYWCWLVGAMTNWHAASW